jgi:UDP-glucose 4-epimerase
MSRILITGGSGLLGKELCQKLSGHTVITFPRSTVDLRDKRLVERVMVKARPDVVYHLAANACEARGQVSPIDMTENNLTIFLTVLVASINSHVKRFIYTSSVAVYGEAELPYAEDSIPKPKDVYGVNKLACEQILKILAKEHHFDYTIFRPHNLYGKNQDMGNPYKNVVALFMRSLLTDTAITLFGEGRMKRAFSYAPDVAQVLIDGMEPAFRNQTVNVGASSDITIADLLTTLERISGKKAKIKQKPARDFEIWNFLADHHKQNMLTTYHETPLEVGLTETWNTYILPPLKEQEAEILW